MQNPQKGRTAGETVLVTVSGLQTREDDSDVIEVVTQGRYFERAGKKYVFYEEEGEKPEEKVKNLVEIEPEHVEVVKKGMVEARLFFEKGQKIKSLYQTPFGSMEVGVYTEDIHIREEQEGIRMELDYRLEMNNEFVGANRISLKTEKITG